MFNFMKRHVDVAELAHLYLINTAQREGNYIYNMTKSLSKVISFVDALDKGEPIDMKQVRESKEELRMLLNESKDNFALLAEDIKGLQSLGV